VAGVSLREDSTQGGFIWRDGVMTDLGSLGGMPPWRTPSRRGQVVGGSNRAEDSSVGAFVWHDGVMIDLGGANSIALGINERGQVIGLVYAADLLSSSAFMWQAGVMTNSRARRQSCCCRGHRRARPDRRAVQTADGATAR